MLSFLYEFFGDLADCLCSSCITHSIHFDFSLAERVQRIQFPSPMATVSEQSEDRKQQEHKYTNTKMGGKSFVLMNFFCP